MKQFWRSVTLKPLIVVFKMNKNKMWWKILFCFILNVLLLRLIVSTVSHKKHRSVDLLVHRHIESVYKKAVLNSDGTLGVRVHNRKINVDDIFGLEAAQREEKWNNNKASFHFNISKLLAQNGRVIAAEFYLKVRPRPQVQVTNITLSVRKYHYKEKAKLYTVDWQVCCYNMLGELSFDVGRVVQYWRHSNQTLAELVIELEQLNNIGSSHRKAHSTIPRVTFFSGYRNGPCLVVYFTGNTPLVATPLDSVILNKVKVLNTSPIISPANASDDSSRFRRASSNICKRSDFMISLPDLFEDVIFPSKVSVGHCHGGCVFPVDSELTPTSHALIILVSYIQNGIWKGNRPYCVPSRYRAISVFAQNLKTSSYHLMTWKTAVATHCGCR